MRRQNDGVHLVVIKEEGHQLIRLFGCALQHYDCRLGLLDLSKEDKEGSERRAMTTQAAAEPDILFISCMNQLRRNAGGQISELIWKLPLWQTVSWWWEMTKGWQC